MMYLDGGKSYTSYFANVGQAQQFYRNLGFRYRTIAVAAGLVCTLSCTALGSIIGNVGGAVIGALFGAIGGLITGNVIYGWGTTYYDCAYTLSNYKKSKKCSVTFTRYGTRLYYNVKVK